MKSYREFNNYQANRPPFTTEQKPGSGGFRHAYLKQTGATSSAAKEARAEALKLTDPDDLPQIRMIMKTIRDLTPAVTADAFSGRS